VENKKINERELVERELVERELVVPFESHTIKLVEECRKKEFEENREKGGRTRGATAGLRPAGPKVRQSRSVNPLNFNREKNSFLC
jgi:hypothetical protein